MPDPIASQSTVQPGIVDTDILLLRPPFTLPHQVPLTAEADSLLAQMRILEESARRIAADRDAAQAYLLRALEGREQALTDLGRLAGVALLEHAENVELHARLAELRSTATTVEFARIPWPAEPAPDEDQPPRHRARHGRRGRAQRNQSIPVGCTCGCPNDLTL